MERIMDKLDSVTRSILQAADVDDDLLPTLTPEDLKELFPNMGDFGRRKRLWTLIHPEIEKPSLQDTAGPLAQSLSSPGGSQTSECFSPQSLSSPSSTATKQASSPLDKSPNLTLQLPAPPEYIVYTDTELEQLRKHYFELARIGKQGECEMSKELRCRLVRNTVTSMVSILRANQQAQARPLKYPSKQEVLAMAERLADFYPMLQDKVGPDKHRSIFGFLQKRFLNMKSPKKQKPTKAPVPKKKRRLVYSEGQDVDEESGASTIILDQHSDSSEDLNCPDVLVPPLERQNAGVNLDVERPPPQIRTAAQKMYFAAQSHSEAEHQPGQAQEESRPALLYEKPAAESGSFEPAAQEKSPPAQAQESTPALLYKKRKALRGSVEPAAQIQSPAPQRRESPAQAPSTDSREAQARHYKTLQKLYTKQKPNRQAVAQILDLEFETRRDLIDGDIFREDDRPEKIFDAYPCFKDLDHVKDELRRILDRENPRFLNEVKERLDAFFRLVQFYAVWKKVIKSMPTDGVELAVKFIGALPALFPSATPAPKKLGGNSEALLHVLEPNEDAERFLQGRCIRSPVLVLDRPRCLIAVGNMPITTFPEEDLLHGLLYLLGYYYTLHLCYPKCVATVLSVLQTEVLKDSIHDRDQTTAYKKAIAEYKGWSAE